MELSIIIVSFNTRELLKKCLASIKNAEIIVVDNASTDGSVEMVKREFPQVKLIENQENFGFAKANNQGIRIAKGRYILLLNSDTEVKPGALESLVEFAKTHPTVGIIGPRLLNADGSLQPSVYHPLTVWRAIGEYCFGKKGSFEKYLPVSDNPIEVEAVVGAAMLISRELIMKIGLLDERYFMYFEDLDYCRRAKKSGFKVYYLPTAKIFHHHGASGKGSPLTYHYLLQSSKIYHGPFKYLFLTLTIWSCQKWRIFFGKN